MFSKIFKSKELGDFSIIKLDNDSLQKAQENHEIEIVSQFYKEELVEIPTREGVRVHIAKVPYALIGMRSEAVISDLKKRISIGVENYDAYNALKAQVEELKHQNVLLVQDMQPLKDTAIDLQKRLDYLKIVLGNDAFYNAMNSYESAKKQKEAQL